VREEALSLLPLLQPLVVREEPGGATSNARRYILLAGRRTLQLLLEKYSRDHLTWALCVANDAPLPNKDELELLDTLLIKLICRPDPDDLALIATASGRGTFSTVTPSVVVNADVEYDTREPTAVEATPFR